MAHGDLSGTIDCLVSQIEVAEQAGDEYSAAVLRLALDGLMRRVLV
jgi:hypothetical protein